MVRSETSKKMDARVPRRVKCGDRPVTARALEARDGRGSLGPMKSLAGSKTAKLGAPLSF